MNEMENLQYLWLAEVDSVSVAKQNKLLEIYGDVGQIFDKFIDDQERLSRFLGEKNYLALKQLHNYDYLNRRLDMLFGDGIGVLTKASESYPERLNQSEVNPPNVLYYKGDLGILNTQCLAVVGTRHASRYGKEMAQKFVSKFVEMGLTIVSGLATGIDTYAHDTALKVKGKTIAVLGSGLNKITPTINIGMAKVIEEKGLVMTEFKPNFDATLYSFPMRNRIVSGLSDGVFVVEAGKKSGAMITADCAIEQNREVFCLIGNVDSPQSIGCNERIRRGHAKMVIAPEDICEDLHIEYDEKNTNKCLQLDIFEEKIYRALEQGRISFDNLIVALDMMPRDLLSLLTAMELKGIVKKSPGNYYSL